LIGWLIRRVLRLTRLLLLSPLHLLRGLLDRVVGQEVVALQLTEEVPWFAQQDPAWRKYVAPRKVPTVSIEEALVTLAEAARAPAVKAVSLTLDRAALSLAQAEVLLDAIDRVKAAGKKVLVWADGLGGPGLMVASAADKAYAVPIGQLHFLGIRVRAVFVHDLLSILGVVPQMDHHGNYKTMSDMFMRRTMSPAHEEMSKDLGSDLYEQLLTPLIMGRGLTREEAVAALDDGPLDHALATERKVLDGVAYRDEADDLGAKLLDFEDDKKPSRTGPRRLIARHQRRVWLASVFADAPRICVIEVSGSIIGGRTGRGCPALALIDVLNAVRKDKGVKAVVLRINSPGGSALASDIMWRAARRLNEEKPVIASLGEVAASGGYYIAVAARTIVAHASSLVGSIGVVSGKFHIAPALHRWGVGFEGVPFGARAGMYDPDRPFTEDEIQANHTGLMRFYETFLERVCEGRNKTRDEIDAVAQGRVYTGRRALALGLIDHVGDLEKAVTLAADAAGLKAKPALERIEINKPGLAQKLGLSAQAIVGAPVSESLEALAVATTLASEPALAYCPWRVDGI
jgi:protease-4